MTLKEFLESVKEKYSSESFRNALAYQIASMATYENPLFEPAVHKLLLDDAAREETKIKGIKDPFSLSGSKAADIVNRKSKRLIQTLANGGEMLDLESKTRMKIGADMEHYVFTNIAPMWLTDPFWNNKIIVLDKRRYSIYGLPISVEFDALCYSYDGVSDNIDDYQIAKEFKEKFNLEIGQGLAILDLKTEWDYEVFDEIIERAQAQQPSTIEKYMVIDLKISKENIKSNTSKYKHQLNLCAWMGGFDKHTVMVLENNAKLDYWIQPIDNDIVSEILKEYHHYINIVKKIIEKGLMEIAMFDIEGVEFDSPNASKFMRNLIKDVLENDFPNIGNDEVVFSPSDEEKAQELLESLIPIVAEEKKKNIEKEFLVNSIKELNIPIGTKVSTKTNQGTMSWTKFEKKGTSTLDTPKLENYLIQENLKLVAIPNDCDTIEVAVDINLKDYYKQGEDSVVEYPRFTPAKNDDAPDLDWL